MLRENNFLNILFHYEYDDDLESSHQGLSRGNNQQKYWLFVKLHWFQILLKSQNFDLANQLGYCTTSCPSLSTRTRIPYLDMAYCNLPALFVCKLAALIPIRHRWQGAQVHGGCHPGRQAGEVLFSCLYAFITAALSCMVYCCFY